MDLEQMRHNWQKAKLNSGLLEADNRKLAEKLATGRIATAHTKLLRVYRLSAISAAALPVLSPLLVKVLGFPVWTAVAYALFGLVMCILNIAFALFIKRSDVISRPIVEALTSAVKIASYQRYLRAFSLSTGSALIITMFVNALDHSEYHLVIAFVIGLVIGGALGVIKFRRMSALTHQMQDELRSML